MTDGFAHTMRSKLLALRNELETLASSGDEAAQVVELDQSRVGRLSRMDALQAQAMSQASGRRREALLRGIAAALARIDEGSYGICVTCDQDIPRGRLDIDPTASMCVDCAGKAESQAF